MKEKLLTLLRRWQVTRETYPGWIVAPKESRESLLMMTINWVDAIFSNLANFSPPDDLALLFELLWRWERILAPLFVPWIPKIEEVLDRYDMEAKRVKGGAGDSLTPNTRLDWRDIEDKWMAISFAVLRTAREDFQEEPYFRWNKRLGELSKTNAEWLARWHYESCLHSLWHCDVAALRAGLDAWEPLDGSPVWQTRKASLCAELGEISEAEELASNSLILLREMISSDGMNFRSLSQEGWCLCLHKALADDLLHYSKPTSDHYRARWNRLLETRCNPWPELEALGLILDRSESPIPPQNEVRRGFDPDDVHETNRYGNDLPKLIPAFALLRLFEEAGLPMRVGRGNFCGSAIANAASWIWEMSPFQALGALMRINNTAVLESVFSRGNIATLDETKVQKFALWGLDVMQKIVNSLASLDLNKEDFGSALIHPASEMLSRVCVRMPPEFLGKVFELSCRMARSLHFRMVTWRYDAVKILFHRLFQVVTPSQLAEWLPSLLGLPIESTDFPVAVRQLWRDPFSEVRIDQCRLALESSPTVREKVTQSAETLLVNAEHASGGAREQILSRLAPLCLADGLTERQKEAFAVILWSQLNQATHLPSEIGFRLNLVLHLPAPPNINPKARLASALVVLAKRRTLHIVKDATGAERKSSQQLHPDSHYLQLLESVSVMPLLRFDDDDKRIDWTEQEAIEHLERAAQWWDDEKRDAPSQFICLPTILSDLILPRLSSQAQIPRENVYRLLRELEEAGFGVLESLPSQVFVGRISAEDAVGKLLPALQSSRYQVGVDAIKAISNWSRAVASQKIERLPSAVVDGVVGKAEFRREPCLSFAFDLLALWLKDDRPWIDNTHIERLPVSLELLIEETSPQAYVILKREDNRNALPIADEDILDRRRSVVRFAGAMARWMERKKLPKQAVLDLWEKVAANDPLPEIRNAWKG